MLRRVFQICAAAAWLMAGIVPAATAGETALVGLHVQERMGNKACFAEHEHYGKGNGYTKRQALRDMVRRWSSFTSLEYGKVWGHYSRAVDKRIGCKLYGRSDWVCEVTARPCRYASKRYLRSIQSQRRRAKHRKMVRHKVRQHRKMRRVYR